MRAPGVVVEKAIIGDPKNRHNPTVPPTSQDIRQYPRSPLPDRRSPVKQTTVRLCWVAIPIPYAGFVARNIWTAEELEKLTPAEKDAEFQASIVTDLSEVPPEYLERVRSRLLSRTSPPSSSKPA